MPAPKASVKALKITKGRPIEQGVVFVDGKFVDPPYVVERYGNVIRINGVQVTQPVIDWAEFLKTQPEVSVTRTETPPAPEVPAPAAAPAPEPVQAAEIKTDSDEDPLDDLFDDEPAKTVKAEPVKASPPPPPVAEPKPTVVTMVRLEGAFELNDRAKGLVSKVNLVRRDIDAALRRGGFFCFGSSYSRVSGDKTLAFQIMDKVPNAMRRHSDLDSFAAELRQAGLVYFNPRLVRDLFAHRLDYLRLQKRYRRMRDHAETEAMIERAESNSLL